MRVRARVIALLLVTVLVHSVLLHIYVGNTVHFDYLRRKGVTNNGVQVSVSGAGVQDDVARTSKIRYSPTSADSEHRVGTLLDASGSDDTRDSAGIGSGGARDNAGTDDSSHLLVHQLVTLPANKEVQRIICNSTPYWTSMLQLPVDKYFEICNDTKSPNTKLLEVIMVKNTSREYAELLARYSSRDKDIILPMIDMSFMDMTMNFYLSSIKRLNITNYIFLTLDTKARDFLRSRGINCFHYSTNQDTDKATRFNTEEHNCKINSRYVYNLHALLLGYNVLTLDVDIVLLQNPWHAVVSECSNCDIAYQLDQNEINTGFIFTRATPATILLYVAFQYQRDASQCKTYNQGVINRLAQRIKSITPIRLQGLDRHRFQSGYQFWDVEKRTFPQDVKECDDCVSVHSNYIAGKVTKIQRFKEAGLWYNDDNQYFSDPNRRYIMIGDNVIPQRGNAEVVKTLVTISILLNRTAILPKFVFDSKVRSIVQVCTFEIFDNCFVNYREHYFLNHTLVPSDIKSNVSPLFGVIQTKGSLEVSNNTTIDSVAVELSHQHVISLLGSTMFDKYSVLRINVWSIKIQKIGCIENMTLL